MRNWIFVQVRTDQPGLEGWGEATLEWKTRAVVGAVEDLAPLLLGRDPRDLDQLVRVLTKHSFWRLGVRGRGPFGARGWPCHDIFGKSLGVPVWRLLGGRTRDRVPVYTHLGLGEMTAVYESLDEAPLVERAHEVVERGYRALKAVFIPYTHYTVSPRQIDKVARCMNAIRDAVGQEVEVMVDFHGRCGSASAALQYIEAIAPFRPLFVEEPLPPGETLGLAAIKAKTPVPIAAGERLVDRREFDELFRARAIDIAQPDLCHVGGFGEARKIAAMAETANCGIAPHNPLGPIAGVAALHYDRATPNLVIQEEMVGAVPWYGEVVRGPIRMVDGAWQVPDAPGLGIEVDEKVAAAHPFAQEVLHATNAVLPDGTVVDW